MIVLKRWWFVCSWEQTAYLFVQLSSEHLQDGIGVESLYLLVQELQTATHRSITLHRLFWRVRLRAAPGEGNVQKLCELH